MTASAQRSLSRPFLLFTALGLSAIALLPTPPSALAEEWTEVKDIKGRKLTVKIEKVEDGQVTFSIKNGKTYTYAIEKFSVTDQLTLRRWKPSESTSNPVEEDAKLTQVRSSNTETAFQTKHFEFQVVGPSADEKKVEAFAPAFEAVHWAFSFLPVSLEPQPKESHFQVKLYLTETDFEVATQEMLREDQPAVYNLGKDVLLAPIGRVKPSPALTREIAFLLLGERLNSLPPWVAVAVTEYLAAAPFDGKSLDMKDPFENMLRYLGEAYGLTNKTMPMLEPSTVWALDYASFRSDGLEGKKSRSSALLAFYYFAHLDCDGKGMESYLRGLRTGLSPDEALATLTNDRDEALLNDDLKVAYVPKKIRIAYIK